MVDFQSKSKKVFPRCLAGKIGLTTKFLFAFFLLGIITTELSVAAVPVNVKQSKVSKIWVGTWATSPMLVEPNNMPPSPELTNNTLRQVIHVSIGGNVVRLRFSNVFSKSPVTMKKVAIAVSKEGGRVDASTQKMLTFKKMNEVTMAPNEEVTSDPLSFNLVAGSRLAITIYFGSTSPDVTGHPGSRTTSYILEGDNVSKADFDKAVTTDHW